MARHKGHSMSASGCRQHDKDARAYQMAGRAYLTLKSSLHSISPPPPAQDY